MITPTAFVYKITNPAGKIYIGSTLNPKKRFDTYRKLDCKKQVKLYNSFIKYGFENHTLEIIWQGDSDLVLRMEYQLGIEHQVLDRNKGLNLLLPKEGDQKCQSDETRARISNSKRGTKNTKQSETLKERYKAGAVPWNKGKIGVQSAWNKGIPRTPEERQKISLNSGNSRIVLDLSTGIFYDSIREASTALNITYDSLLEQLNGKVRKGRTRINKTNLVII
jgi:group I intron endonuclease